MIAETEAAALRGRGRVKVDLRGPARRLRRRGGPQPTAPRSSTRTGRNYFIYEGHHCRRVRFGDVEQGFAEADHVFEWRYQSARSSRRRPRPRAASSSPQADGRLKHPLRHAGVLLHARQHGADPRHAVQQAAHRRRDRRRRVRRQGRRRSSSRSPASRRWLTDRPVKFVYGRYEEMQVSSPRAAERIYIKDGVMDDGRIVARQVTLYVDSGAYSPPQPVRHHEGRGAHARPVHHPERLDRLPTASTPTARRRAPCAGSA